MIVVADTSVLLNLCCVKQIELLRLLFRDVVIPVEVAAEFSRLSTQVPRFTGLSLPSWLRQQTVSGIPPVVRSAAGLDPGETAALALPLEIEADAVLVDERRGHEVARELGFRTIGVLVILLQARVAGLIPQIAPVLDQLQADAGFWVVVALRERVLQLGGEKA